MDKPSDLQNTYVRYGKRILDFSLSLILICGILPLLLFLYLLSSADIGGNGLFIQERVGQNARLFTIYKLKTMHPQIRNISGIGKFLRRFKLDELPQLFNILKGDMSFVGPRPDIPGYYDMLEGDDRRILKLKPGLTSEASIKYRNEEELLEQQEDPEYYNDFILFPDKVKMNLEYLKIRSLKTDIHIIIKTVTSVFEKS